MPTSAKGRLFMRKDGKYLIYVAQKLCQDSMFPFLIKQLTGSEDEEGKESSIPLKISFEIGKKRLIVEEWHEQGEAP